MDPGTDFDYAVYFDDETYDAYYYCIKMEMGHTIYHRFTKEDYQKLVERMYNGEYEVSSDSTTFPETEITATDYGSIK